MKPLTERAWFTKRLNELILDKVKCPIAKVHEIMRLKNWEVNFTDVHCSINRLPFVVEAKSNNITVYGESAVSTHDAKVKAAIKFLDHFRSNYVQLSTSTQNSESIQNDQKSTNTIYNINNHCTETTLLNNSENLKETIFDNKNINTTLITSVTNNLYSDEIKKIIVDGKNNNNTSSNTSITDRSYSSVIKTDGVKYSNKDIINLLQEKCMANHWGFPEYKLTQMKSNSHGNIEFTMECNWLNMKTIGKGSSKQEAKKLAAAIIYDKISGCSNEELNEMHQFEQEHTIPFEYLLPENECINVIKKRISPETLTQLDLFLKHYKHIDEPCSDDLNESNSSNEFINKEPYEILEEIAKENGFTVKYVAIASSVQFEVIVQLSTDPITVHIGNGNTLFNAKRAAAITTLLYLKTKFTNPGI